MSPSVLKATPISLTLTLITTSWTTTAGFRCCCCHEVVVAAAIVAVAMMLLLLLLLTLDCENGDHWSYVVADATVN